MLPLPPFACPCKFLMDTPALEPWPIVALCWRLCYTTVMVIGVSQITLHLPDSHSLKDKRQIVKSVVARVRNRFEVAIAEVEEQDRWQIAILGISCVTNSSQHAGEVLGHVQRYIEETRPDIILSNVEKEIITW